MGCKATTKGRKITTLYPAKDVLKRLEQKFPKRKKNF